MKNRAWAVLMAVMMLSGVVAWSQQKAPVNPAFARWQREQAAKVPEQDPAGEKAQARRRAVMRGEGDAGDADFGLVPTVLDTGYLADWNDNLMQGVGDDLPTRYDLREHGGITGVRDQGLYSTCWAFAAIGALESGIVRSEGVEADWSENNLANHHGWSLGFNAGGNSLMAGGYLLRWGGPVAESADPYPQPGRAVDGEVGRHVQRVLWIPGKTGPLDHDRIKEALLEHGALQASYYHAAGYYHAGKANYYCPATAAPANHSVVLAGWDDSYSRQNFKIPPPGDGAYLVKNSWGTDWGTDGYFYVSYFDATFARETLYAFLNAEATDNYDGIYQHDPLGIVAPIDMGSSTAWGANMFVASGQTTVAAVGFYAMVPRTVYAVAVYAGCEAGNPTSGRLVAERNGTTDGAGYVTIPVASTGGVNAGERFSVVVKLTTPGYKYPLAAEYAIPGYTSLATASSGESFWSRDGHKWADFTKTLDSTANFCCKAYVKQEVSMAKLAGIAIHGVNSLQSGNSAEFSCTASYSDGTESTVVPTWTMASGEEWAEVDQTGTVTAAEVMENHTATVCATYTEGGETASATWTLYITVAPPAVPSGLTATEGTETSCVRLAWEAVPGASSYAVYRGTQDEGAKAGYLGTVTAIRYADTTAKPGVDYRYFVKAKNDSGSSDFSAGTWGWRALSAPSGLIASDGTSEDCVTVSWIPSEGAAGYRVWRADGGAADETATTISGWLTGNRFEDTNAVAGTEYSYWATAALDTDGTRESAFGVPDNGWRAKPHVLERLEIAGPAQIEAGETGRFTCEAGYGDGMLEAVTPAWTVEGGTIIESGATATVQAPVVAETSEMSLTAVWSDGATTVTGRFEIVVVPVAPSAPSGLQIVAATENGVSLSWNAVENARGYSVWRAEAGGQAVLLASTTETEWTDEGGAPGVEYVYWVSAENAAGSSDPESTGLSARRLVAGPVRVTATHGDRSASITVSWSASAGAAYHRVWRADSPNGEKSALGSWQAGTSFDDTTAVVGQEYFYFVRSAVDSSGTAAGGFGGPASGLRLAPMEAVSLSISGLSEVAAGTSAAYAARIRFNDGTEMSVNPTWSISGGGDWAEIDASGILTVPADAPDATLTISAITTELAALTAEMAVQVLGTPEASAQITDLTLHARWPWNGWVDVDYTLETAPTDTLAVVTLSGRDYDHREHLSATTLEGDGANGRPVEAGEHRISWNVGQDYPGFHAKDFHVSMTAEPWKDTVGPMGDLSDGLVAYWPFDGDAKDASGNGNHGTVNGATLTVDRNGKANGAYYFDGNDSIRVPDSPSLRSPTNAMSVAFWIKAPAESPTSIILCKGQGRRQYGLFIHTGDDGTSVCVNDYMGENGVDVICHECPHIPTDNVWQHIAVAWDGVTMKVYADGVQIDEESAQGVFATNTYDLLIGEDPPGATEYLLGALDDLAIWNRALTAEEIARLYAGDVPVAPETEKGRYEIVPWTLGWKAAKADAEAKGGHLATITSEAEWAIVTNLFGLDLSMCWLGGTDEEEGGVWQWVTGEEWNYSRWAPNEPNNEYGYEHYLHMQGDETIEWNDMREDDFRVTKYLLEYDDAIIPVPVVPNLPDGLVAYWPFDGDAKDASGNGNDGMVNGATLAVGRDGKANGAYHFDGNDTITVADNALLRSVTNEFTIATWLKYDQTCLTGEEWVTVLSKGTTQHQYGLNMSKSNVTHTEIGSSHHAAFDTFPSQGEWVHVAVTFVASGLATSYVNGQVVGTLQNSPGLILNSQPLVIGADQYNSTEYLYGSLDDLAIWNRALTAEEIASLVAGAEPVIPVAPVNISDGLVAYWPFDGDAKDASGNENDGAVNGATLTADRNGLANGAYYFDGNDSIRVPDSLSLRSPTNAMSVAFWIKAPTGTYSSPILCKGQNTRQYGLVIYTDGSTYVILNDYNGENGVEVSCHDCPFIPAGDVWQHIVTTWDGETITVYADGVKICEDSAPGVFAANTADLLIGAEPPGATEYLSGSLDDLAIWNRALTAEEVARLFAGERPAVQAKYLVLDLSGGPSAESWPIEYLDEEPAGGFNTDEYKTTKLVLRRIEPGTFMMGSSSESDNQPHQVTLTKPYYMGVFEVTQKQYELVTGRKPSYFNNAACYEKRPVESVSWNTIRGNSSTFNWPNSAEVDANSFMGRLRARMGLEFDLPTEAQWEYACRAGTTSSYNNGGNSEDDLKQLGRYCFNGGQNSSSSCDTSEGTAEVGSYLPNAWGLYDMHGNVCEWCLDWYGSLTGGVTDPVGPSSGSYRVRRGGVWSSNAGGCTSSNRDSINPSREPILNGFRLVRTLSK